MKYRLDPVGSTGWFQIVALKDTPGVCKAGDLGGYVKSEQNLSQQGNCWINWRSHVYDTARVEGDAQVINTVLYDNVVVKDMAVVKNSALLGKVVIGGFAEVVNQVIDGNARIMNAKDVDELAL